MLIDNENKNLKVHEWISKYVEEGHMDVVTGYFTVSALAFLARETNSKIREFRFVLGDIVSTENIDDRTIDLLNENITVEAAVKLSQLAKEAVDFLKQDKVAAKTLEPNFCHAKLYLFKAANDERHNFFVSGSSNLTEAGIGLKKTQNVELNISETGDNNQYKELIAWFNDLWGKPQAHNKKTLVDNEGKKYEKPFKDYLIGEIEKLFVKYTPRQLYYKVLFELFGHQLLLEKDDAEFNRKVGKLENTVIYKTLYEFQKKGVLSLIKMMQKYNGAILADAVGLGKTWSALAVIKFFEFEGLDTVLICPKKLEQNWSRYLKRHDSKFEKDEFDYLVRFHTDLQDDRIFKKTGASREWFQNDKPKLLVIDESHNLRNSKSGRYQFLLEDILKKKGDWKVLMLSATPINNTLLDIRNQFKLIVEGDTKGFEEPLGVKNIDYTFRAAQKSFNQWKEENNPKIGEFIKSLPANFFKLTDNLTVARTRKMIEGMQTGLEFPEKVPPSNGGISENIFVTPSQMGNFESFEELLEHFPPMLSGYQPAFYVEELEDADILHDERQRDFFLVKMMYILMVKRLESSWISFYSTVQKILNHHQTALDRIKAYQEAKEDAEIEDTPQITMFEDDELEDELEEFTLGKRRKISLSEIDKAGMLDLYKKDLKKDIDSLELLRANLERFEERISKEVKKPNNHETEDDKLEVLIQKIKQKRKHTANKDNSKVVIFTVYKDTAYYLFNQLNQRGFTKIAVVSGDKSRTADMEGETRNFEPILERFCPFTKLFREKEWDFKPGSSDLTLQQQYDEWVEWVADTDKKTYEKLKNPIDILITTDTLSEGQNLQDCDTVVNYDIHWNPVRVIQRMGRIDRIGSPNEKIYGVNFWPSNSIESYLNLKGRVEGRMAAMQLAGSEVQLEFSDTFKEMAQDKDLEDKLNERMMQQMETTWDDIDVSDRGLGFDDLSLERFRQELMEELQRDEKFYKDMPKAVYTGFNKEYETCPEKGIIALLGYPSRPPKVAEYSYSDYELIYIDMEGKQVVLNQKEVLDALTEHKEKQRFVPNEIDKGEEKAISGLVSAIKYWLKSQAAEEEKLEDGTTEKKMGKEAKDIIQKLKAGDKVAVERIKQNIKVSDKYQSENFDLIAWFIVS